MIDGGKNNSENSSTTKVGENIPSDFPMSTISPFKNIENKHDVYRGKDCLKKFCKSLTLFTINGQKSPLPPTSLFPNVGISPQNFLTFRFIPFATLV